MSAGTRGPRRAVIIDNEDSFTHNIAQYLTVSGAHVEILGNDTDANLVEAVQPTHLVLSAGGGQADDPRDYKNAYRIVERFAGRVPILGVCLGHQILARYLGARVVLARDGRHGRISTLVRTPTRAALLQGLPRDAAVMRYHSSVVAHGSLPPSVTVTGVARDDGEIMSFESLGQRLFGVQFHPDSVGTPHGLRIFVNLLSA